MSTNLQFIKQVLVSNTTSTINVDEVFSAKYKNYMLQIPKIQNISNDYLACRLLKTSDGSADTTTNYDIASIFYSQVGTHFVTGKSTNQTSWDDALALISGTTHSHLYGGLNMYIYNPFENDHTFVSSQYAGYYVGGVYPIGGRAIAQHHLDQSHSGIQFLLNVNQMEVNVYGVKD